MKLKLSQLVNSSQAFSRLMSQPMRAVKSFALSKVARQIEPDLKAYDEQRIKLLKEYGKLRDESGQQYEFDTPRQAQEFVAELNALLEQDVELDVKPILLADLDKIEISAVDILTLGWLIVDSSD